MANQEFQEVNKPLNLSVAYIAERIGEEKYHYQGVIYYGDKDRPLYLANVDIQVSGYSKLVKHCFDTAMQFVGPKYYLGTTAFNCIKLIDNFR